MLTRWLKGVGIFLRLAGVLIVLWIGCLPIMLIFHLADGNALAAQALSGMYVLWLVPLMLESAFEMCGFSLRKKPIDEV
jgi:hypothetical protein